MSQNQVTLEAQGTDGRGREQVLGQRMLQQRAGKGDRREGECSALWDAPRGRWTQTHKGPFGWDQTLLVTFARGCEVEGGGTGGGGKGGCSQRPGWGRGDRAAERRLEGGKRVLA